MLHAIQGRWGGMLVACLLVIFSPGTTRSLLAHDIPNAQVDRSIQVIASPGRLVVEYEVSLADLTLAQDLRSLIGEIPPEITTRDDLYALYARETGPLNARGLLVTVDDEPVDLTLDGFEIVVQEHPIFTYDLSASLPEQGRLTLIDTNYVSSEGTSRLAFRPEQRLVATGYTGPEDVADVLIRPVWMLSDDEERSTKQVEVEFETPASLTVLSVTPDREPPPTPTLRPDTPPARDLAGSSNPASLTDSAAARSLTRLLEGREGLSLFGLCLLALGLGAAHAIQPGHGKALVAAATLGERQRMFRGVLLAVVTTLVHTGGVLLVAIALWVTRSTRYGDINSALLGGAGFLIAAIGLWRVGRHLAGHGEHGPVEVTLPVDPEARDVHRRGREPQGPNSPGFRGLIGLGFAAGIVPCWDAVILIILAETLGRLGLGILLLGAFSTGMAAVLVGVGLAMAQVGRFVTRGDGQRRWERRLGLLSGLVLAGIGISMLAAS